MPRLCLFFNFLNETSDTFLWKKLLSQCDGAERGFSFWSMVIVMQVRCGSATLLSA